ncbi:hypothetical protein [Paenibacillus amylolyticus]|uniref:hypothetical protein n=1 Tax=Paenibacillus amylolyticus TaxID=1451 RepID=UPI00339982A9
MSTLTTDFQRDVATKLSTYFAKKINDIQETNPRLYAEIAEEYTYILQSISNGDNINVEGSNLQVNWLSCLSEPSTHYTRRDLTGREEDDDNVIYSPRVDLAITPTIMTKRGKQKSLAIHRYGQAPNRDLFHTINQCEFIQEIENRLREISSENYSGLEVRDSDPRPIHNTRPVHFFGIEIENQTNPKHLMGDFLNVISLSRIPVVLFPEDKFNGCIKMLSFSQAVEDIKGVTTFSTFRHALILKVDQFRDTMNDFLSREGLELIGVYDYR